MNTKQIISALGGIKEAATITGLTTGRIYQMIQDDKIPRGWHMFFHALKPKSIPHPDSYVSEESHNDSIEHAN